MKTEREQFLDDVIITALEGGIGYWSVCESYKWGDDKPTVAVISDSEGNDFANVTVDRGVVEKGLATMSAGPVKYLHERTRGRMMAASTSLDAGDIDSHDADCIVQTGLFGKVVYG